MTNMTLWHVPVSHFSEKVRWALDLKGVPHRRVALLGGTHPVVTRLLTRGRHGTVPVLTIGTRAIGDSTAILAELEARFADPPLHPADPEERRRALELEDWLDRDLGPAIRRLTYHELLGDPEGRRQVAGVQAPWLPARTRAAAGRLFAVGIDQRFGTASEDAARRAEDRVAAVLDRLEAELGDRPYLAGDGFSVADLTAASLLYPLALPPEGPWRPEYVPDTWQRRIDEAAGRPAVLWARGLYARHRHPA